MKYTGIKCEGCGKTFTEDDDVVVCPVCGTPQHRSCWLDNGSCVCKDKHSADYAWVMPDWKKEENKPKQEEPSRPRTPNDDIAEQIRFKNDETARACPYCGQLNYGKDAFCIKCHRPLTEEAEQFAGQTGADNNGNDIPQGERDRINYEQGREFYNRFGGINPTEEIDGIPVGELSAYIGGKNPGRMIRRFMMMDRSGRNISFNPAAILLRPIWYLYRGLTKWGMIMLAVILAINIVSVATVFDMDTYRTYYGLMFDYMEELYTNASATGSSAVFSINDFNEYVEENAPEILNSGYSALQYAVSYGSEFALLAVDVIAILFADNLYRKKIKKDILEIRARNTSWEGYMADLSKSGGGKPAMAVVGVILTIAVYYLPSFILSLIALSQVIATR